MDALQRNRLSTDMLSACSIGWCLIILGLDFIHVTSSQDSKEVAILKQMQDWGKGVIRAIEGDGTKGQYLVAALVKDLNKESLTDFHKNLLKGCPSKPDNQNKILKCRASAVILNIQSEAIWKKSEWKDIKEYKNNLWHGEYRLLHDGIMDELVQNFRIDKGENAPCQLILYSYYIPCANIPKNPYSCSKVISDYNNRNDVKCKVYIIGYTEIFRRNDFVKTDKDVAVNFLEACTQLQQIINKVTTVAIKVARASEAALFQESMYKCILNSPLSGCCVDSENNEEQQVRVVSYFVNNLLYEALLEGNLLDKNIAGISQAKKVEIRKSINKVLERKIGMDCTMCSQNSQVAVRFHQYLLGFCAQTALDLSDFLGEPDGGLFSGRWQTLKRKLAQVFDIPPSSSSYKISCAPPYRNFDPSSLCTRQLLVLPELPRKRYRTDEDELVRTRERSRSPMSDYRNN